MQKRFLFVSVYDFIFIGIYCNFESLYDSKIPINSAKYKNSLKIDETMKIWKWHFKTDQLSFYEKIHDYKSV